MATVVEGGNSPIINPKNYRADQGFFLGISVALCLLITFGFLQLALRGITDPVGAPTRVHAHALLLVGWLATLVTQNWLAWRGNIALHRQLGWAAMALVACIVVANYVVTAGVIVEGRTGANGYTPSSFLALGTADTLCFTGLIAWAITRRRDTQWHRRLMFGATLMLSAAGINRIVGGMGGPLAEPITIASQLAFAVVLAWHDRRVLGQIHKATIAIGLVVFVQHALAKLLPMLEPWNMLVNSIFG